MPKQRWNIKKSTKSHPLIRSLEQRRKLYRLIFMAIFSSISDALSFALYVCVVFFFSLCIFSILYNYTTDHCQYHLISTTVFFLCLLEGNTKKKLLPVIIVITIFQLFSHTFFIPFGKQSKLVHFSVILVVSCCNFFLIFDPLTVVQLQCRTVFLLYRVSFISQWTFFFLSLCWICISFHSDQFK